MNKSKEYQLTGISPIRVTDSKTGRELYPGGVFNLLMVGDGFTDEGQIQTMCVDQYESSIWLKDHKNQDLKKKTIEELVFQGGRATVSTSNKKKIEMIERWCLNQSNPKAKEFDGVKTVFQYIDSAKIADEGLQKDELYTKAKYLCNEATERKIHAFADYKGLDISSFNTLKEVRYALITRFNPDQAERFIKEFESDRVEYHYQVKMALSIGDIALDEVSQNVVWSNSKKIIVSYSGQNAIDALINYCLSAEGKIFYQSLTSGQVKSELDEKVAMNPTEVEVKNSNSVDLPIKDMVELGMSKGIISLKSDNYYYGSRCGKDLDGVVNHFKSKPEKVKKLKLELGI